MNFAINNAMINTITGNGIALVETYVGEYHLALEIWDDIALTLFARNIEREWDFENLGEGLESFLKVLAKLSSGDDAPWSAIRKPDNIIDYNMMDFEVEASYSELNW